MKSFIFVLAVMLTLGLATIASAQVTSTSVPSALTITPAGSGIAISNVDCDVTDVIRGVHYTVLFDAAGGASVIHPADNGEVTTDLGADITADPGQDVSVAFILPSALTGTAGVIGLVWDQVGARVEDGALFNPNVSNSFNAGSGGAISLRLGFSFTVPVSALSGDTYAGTLLTTASYTGAP